MLVPNLQTLQSQEKAEVFTGFILMQKLSDQPLTSKIKAQGDSTIQKNKCKSRYDKMDNV